MEQVRNEVALVVKDFPVASKNDKTKKDGKVLQKSKNLWDQAGD